MWLGALPVPMELTLEACGQLNKMATEMLDNAERHGGHATAIGDWYVAGFMARRNDNSNTQSSWYECHIAIVNLGTTIAESISRSSEPQMLSDLRTYTAKHTGRRRQSTDALTTVYAMQDGVSSLPQGKGGMGMMEMVELVNALGTTSHQAHQPAITIISGRSCVRFAGPFKGFRSSMASVKRIQPFNVEGSFEFPPHPHYVFDLDYEFPGTIIAVRFSLDYQAMIRRSNEHD